MIKNYLYSQALRVFDMLQQFARLVEAEQPSVAEQVRSIAAYLQDPLESFEHTQRYQEPVKMLGRRQGHDFLIMAQDDSFVAWIGTRKLEMMYPDFHTALAAVRANLRDSGVPDDQLP
ncbi:MAG: hypothetical protein M3R24_20380 [Chloroflexota bacterium]|nr:hypothetical protein [Chloroflexota bacterium]